MRGQAGYLAGEGPPGSQGGRWEDGSLSPQTAASLGMSGGSEDTWPSENSAPCPWAPPWGSLPGDSRAPRTQPSREWAAGRSWGAGQVPWGDEGEGVSILGRLCLRGLLCGLGTVPLGRPWEVRTDAQRRAVLGFLFRLQAFGLRDPSASGEGAERRGSCFVPQAGQPGRALWAASPVRSLLPAHLEQARPGALLGSSGQERWAWVCPAGMAGPPVLWVQVIGEASWKRWPWSQAAASAHGGLEERRGGGVQMGRRQTPEAGKAGLPCLMGEGLGWDPEQGAQRVGWGLAAGAVKAVGHGATGAADERQEEPECPARLGGAAG